MAYYQQSASCCAAPQFFSSEVMMTAQRCPEGWASQIQDEAQRLVNGLHPLWTDHSLPR